MNDRRKDAHARRDAERLAMHQIVAERLREDPEGVLEIARENLARWTRTGPQPYYEAWEELLRSHSVEELIGLIAARDAEGRRLRQSSPFVGVLTPEERASIFGREPNDSGRI